MKMIKFFLVLILFFRNLTNKEVEENGSGTCSNNTSQENEGCQQHGEKATVKQKGGVMMKGGDDKIRIG